MQNYQKMSTSILLQALEVAVGERAMLQFSDAPVEELAIVQDKIDEVERELIRRSSW